MPRIILDIVEPFPNNCEYDYQTDTFWSTEFQQFAYTKHDLADQKWYWYLLPKETALSDTQRLTHKELQSVFGDNIIFRQQPLDLRQLPQGYSAYLKILSREAKNPSSSKAPMESLSELEINPKQPISSPEVPASPEEIKIKPPTDKTKPVPTMRTVPTTQQPIFIQATPMALAVTTATTTPNNIIAPPDNFDGRPTLFEAFGQQPWPL